MYWIFKMTGSWNNFGIILLLSFFRFQVMQAEITLPAFGNLTFIYNGTDVTLPWTYNFSSATVLSVQWQFSKTGEPGSFKQLAALPANGEPIILSDTFSGISVIRPATLVLQNVNLDHNGTYRILFTLVGPGVTSPQTSDILVIVLVPPVADISCSGKTDSDFVCVCKSENNVGNPPPLAYWLRNDKLIGTSGYLRNNLYLPNITEGEPATYTCKMQSHSLADNQSISFKIPEVTFESSKPGKVPLNEPVTLTCKARGILPTKYYISFNGTILDGVENGVKKIHRVNESHVGIYNCTVVNIIGLNSSQLLLNITGESRTTTTRHPDAKSTTSTSPNTAPSSPVGTRGASLGPGAIAGIVVGILFLIIVAVALVYWFHFKNPNDQGICGCTKKEDTGGDQVVNHGVGAYDQPSKAENPYESVDGEKTNSDQQAGPSGDTSPPPGGSSGLPPVYAVVDKNKKTKKPPPKSQPPSVTYASLDPVDLQPDSSKMRDRSREETNYADIDLGKLQSDLV